MTLIGIKPSILAFKSKIPTVRNSEPDLDYHSLQLYTFKSFAVHLSYIINDLKPTYY